MSSPYAKECVSHRKQGTLLQVAQLAELADVCSGTGIPSPPSKCMIIKNKDLRERHFSSYKELCLLLITTVAMRAGNKVKRQQAVAFQG
jgi:hypothetical protein